MSIQLVTEPASVQHIMNDIIFALLIDALVISHLCQNAGIAYSAVDTADSILLEHLHTLIDPDEPLTKIARKIVDVFLENVCCELDDIARLINNLIREKN